MTQIEALLGFLGEAVTPFHAVAAMSLRLQDAGFEEVQRFDLGYALDSRAGLCGGYSTAGVATHGVLPASGLKEVRTS